MRSRSIFLSTIVLAAAIPVAASELETTPCTVKKVDAAARAVTVVTGTGYALRLRVFRVDPQCRIAVAGGEAALSAVKPGQLVVVEHRTIDGREVAVSITSVSQHESRGRP